MKRDDSSTEEKRLLDDKYFMAYRIVDKILSGKKITQKEVNWVKAFQNKVQKEKQLAFDW